MDEILIDEKKYVSSKQAAKITGYAKDYIGQLCREGRVPARLVGRGWYVLESAIQDHRFGNPEDSKVVETEEKAPEIAKTWEFPRYEATVTDVLPSINRLNDAKVTPEVALEEEVEEEEVVVPTEEPQNVHDSWREWFDHIAEVEAANSVATPVEAPKTAPVIDEPKDVLPTEDAEVNVPLRVVSEYFPTKEIPVEEKRSSQQPTPARKSGSRAVVRVIQTAVGLVMLATLFLACAGSGYLDNYLISNSQADLLLGVQVYNK